MPITFTDLKSYVGATSTDDAFVSDCFDEAKLLVNNFADATINTKDIPIIYEGIEYYSIEQNYNMDSVEYLTIDYKNLIKELKEKE